MTQAYYSETDQKTVVDFLQKKGMDTKVRRIESGDGAVDRVIAKGNLVLSATDQIPDLRGVIIEGTLDATEITGEERAKLPRAVKNIAIAQ